MKALLHLVSVDAGYKAFAALWPRLKNELLDGNRLEVEVRPERRNTAQNALLHALLSELSTRKEWAGKLRDVDAWKRLIVAAWLRAEGRSVEVLPAIDGHGIDIVYVPTHTLTKSELASLIDYLTAYLVEQGIDVGEPA